MFSEKFVLLLDALKSRFFEDVPPTVTSARAAFLNLLQTSAVWPSDAGRRNRERAPLHSSFVAAYESDWGPLPDLGLILFGACRRWMLQLMTNQDLSFQRHPRPEQ